MRIGAVIGLCIGGALALAGAALFLLESGSGGDATRVTVTSDVPRSDASAQSEPSAPESLPAPLPAAETTRESPSALGENDPSLVLVVTAAETAAPIARPVAWRVTTSPEEMRMSSLRYDAEAVRTRGERFDGDANGHVVIPLADRSMAVAVFDRDSAPTRASIVVIDPPRASTVGELAVPLAKERAFIVRVRDTGGHAVLGLPIRIASNWMDETLFEGATGADGSVSVPHAQCIVIEDANRVSVNARISGSGSESHFDLPAGISQPLAKSALDAGAMTLVVPECGALTLEFENADGSKCTDRVVAWTSIGRDTRERLAGDGGKIELPWFPVGKQVNVSAIPADGSAPLIDASGDGPKQGGEHATIRVRLAPRIDGPKAPPGTAVLRGKLVTSEGRPAAGARVRLVLDEMASIAFGSSMASTVERDGRFELRSTDLAHPIVPKRARLRATRTTGFEEAKVDLTGLLVPGFHDLGTVALEGSVLWASGHAVDENGKPVANCTIAAQAPGILASDATGKTIPYVETITDAAGAFALRAPPSKTGESGAPIPIDATSPRFRREHVNVEFGASDVVISMHVDHVVFGTILVPEGATAADLDVWWKSDAMRRPEAVAPTIDGRFRIERVLPGVGVLTIVTRFDGALVCTKEGIEVRDGASVEIPAIDLRERVHVVTLHVLGEFGEPCAATVLPSERGSGGRQVGADGTLNLVIGDQPVPIRAASVGSQGKAPLFGKGTLVPTEREAWVRMSH